MIDDNFHLRYLTKNEKFFRIYRDLAAVTVTYVKCPVYAPTTKENYCICHFLF